jgi:predicted ATPase/DNA-binding SARP family transcriptional activator
MSDIRVLLLGPPEVYQDDRQVSIPQELPRVLLYYLASRGSMVERETLLTLLWEDLDETNSRKLLRETLSKLRNLFPKTEYLHTSANLVGLNFNHFHVDQLEFLDLIDQTGHIPWQTPADQPLPEETYALLKSAKGLWRSPHFMSGFDLPPIRRLEEWHVKTASQLEHLYGSVVERLSDHEIATGNLEQALQLVRTALSADSLNQDLHFRAMQILMNLDRKAEAKEYFSDVQKLLREELDTSPAPKLVDLYRQLQGQKTPTQPMASPQKWTVRSSLKVPFVGRRNELSKLHTAMHNGGGVFIFGESGQGKTRLLQQFSEEVEQKTRLLLSVSRPAENTLLFQPFVDLFRHHIRPDEWLALSPAWASQLTLLLPELNVMRPDLERPVSEYSPEASPEQARSLLLEAIRQVFLLISMDENLLFCLDDAQWADEASLATVGYLIERPPFDQRAFLISAARSDEKNPYLEELRRSLSQSPNFSVLNLGRLNQDEISSLVQHTLGHQPQKDFVYRLQRETGGNPLFILEILRALKQDYPDQEIPSPVDLPLTENIQSLIHTRLQRLSPKAREVLEIAAVIGTEFDPEIVEEVCLQEDMTFIKSLEEIQDHLLIEPVSDSPDNPRHRFIHSKIREVMLKEINPMRTRLLHGKVAYALEEKLHGNVYHQAAILARHFEAAGEYSQAFDYWMRAARRARHLFSTSECKQAYGRAERLIDRAPDLTEKQLHHLYTEWTDLLYEADDAREIRRINSNLLRLGRERNSPSLVGTALNGLSDACMATNQFEEGLAYTEKAIPNLEQSDIQYELMEAYNNRGVFLYMLNHFEEAIESFQDALAVGADVHGRHVLHARANAHYQISIVQTLSGWPEIGLKHAIRSLADFSSTNRIHGQISAYSALAFSRYFLGELVRAREDTQIGIEMAQRTASVRMLGYLYIYRAMIELAMGDIDATLEYAQSSLKLGQQYQHREIIAESYRVVGDIFYWLKDPARSVEYYQRALQTSQGKFLAVDHLFRLGLALCLTGNLDEGQAHLSSAISHAKEAGLGMVSLLAQLSQAIVYPLISEWGQAYQKATQVHKEASRRGVTGTRILATILLGNVALQANDTLKAREYFESATKEASQLPYTWLEIQAQTMLDRTLRLADHPDTSIKQHVQQILDRVKPQTSRADIQDAYRNFCEKLSIDSN